MSKFMKFALSALAMSSAGATVTPALASFTPGVGDVINFNVTTVNGSISGNLTFGAGGVIVSDSVTLNELSNPVPNAISTVSGASSINNLSPGQLSNSVHFEFPGTVTFNTTPTVSFGTSLPDYTLTLVEYVSLGSYVKSGVTYTVQGEYTVTLGSLSSLTYGTNSIDPGYQATTGNNVDTSFEIVNQNTSGVVHTSTVLVQDQVLDGTSTVTIPEPASMALVGFGLAGLAFARRRRA